jgi:eukaryotic-like serine/threonine-protein kinase
MSLAAGTRLGPYEIVAPLGAGGMGEVYRARDTRLGREVAVKVLPHSFSKDSDRLRRFEQEARAVSALNHPNILTIHDVGEHNGAPYVVTELLEGETLRSRMAAGAVSPKRALELALPIAHGLAAAHEKGIVHRDLKPENVFVTRDGRVKILDFGLAKLTETPDQGSQTGLPTAAPATDPGVVLGTLGYMSPEQVRGKTADARSDIFAFGAILYEMLAGRRAFHGDTAADTMSAILTKDAPELSATNRGVSPGLDRVVRHCLEKDPERRFHSAHDLAFDLEALSDASGARPQAPPPARSWKRLALPIAVAAILGLGALIVWRRSAAAGSLDSVAVLPFANASRDPETEYLSDGITESIINSLSRLPQLRVAARSSVFRYKGKDEDPQKAGRELNVRAVVSGKLLQRGDTLSVQADLVDVGNGAQIWGNHYDRKLADVLAIQEEIAKDVSEKLRPKMTGAEKQKVQKHYTENTEAYQLYLKGRYEWEKRNEASLQKARGFFQQAIDKDPGFALAYCGLADSYGVLPSYSLMSPSEAWPKAKAAARKALEIDEGLAPAHATLGLGLTDWDHDWAGAESHFRRAIEIDPDYPSGHFWYSQLLAALGRSQEAIDQIQRAREADPFSIIIQANLVRVLADARRFDQAIEEGQKAIRDNPNFAPPHFFLGLAYLGAGRRQEAAAEWRKAFEIIPSTPQGVWHRGRAEALEGRREDAIRTIAELTEVSRNRYVSPTYIATILIELGERDQAFEWLRRGVEDRSYDIVYLGVDPLFDAVRDDPRFQDLLRGLKLPAKSPKSDSRSARLAWAPRAPPRDPALGLRQELRLQRREARRQVALLLDVTLRRQLIDDDRKKRGEGRSRRAGRKTQLLRHRLDVALAERVRDLIARHRHVLTGRDPGVRVLGQAGGSKLIQQARKTSRLALDHVRRQIHEGALLLSVPEFADDAAEQLIEETHGDLLW